ncbi:hypothetical protein CLU92_5491 [Janthinobacterium sp. 61]|nr:hypothetical protein CLU92_5491 [Janthinobacterium sp. 61]
MRRSWRVQPFGQHRAHRVDAHRHQHGNEIGKVSDTRHRACVPIAFDVVKLDGAHVHVATQRALGDVGGLRHQADQRAVDGCYHAALQPFGARNDALVGRVGYRTVYYGRTGLNVDFDTMLVDHSQAVITHHYQALGATDGAGRQRTAIKFEGGRNFAHRVFVVIDAHGMPVGGANDGAASRCWRHVDAAQVVACLAHLGDEWCDDRAAPGAQFQLGVHGHVAGRRVAADWQLVGCFLRAFTAHHLSHPAAAQARAPAGCGW